MHEAGAIVAVGSDGGNIGILHGGSYHRELLLMVEARISPMEIIVAATSHGARALGRDSELGTIEPGKLADLVVLNADPLADIRNAHDVHIVIKGGRLIERSALVSPR